MNPAMIVFVGASVAILAIGAVVFVAGCYRIISNISKKLGSTAL